ncbi:sulfite exporter TauE/SafE family protein [Mediterraneibacter sp. NSJ-55]|uniref:Probable membrane transporter protein n=1 Tax=Mediterraneibacter hominis TaxID=2763054 RepID=A0A923RQ65_9FIRM|nr:sulfite exporter TauE/SafE family protein [Mediterraneibacter hominis]MBC5689234.1 sulfite exporter TauE/SafE family protein [Mediterraneibacter hominis]
MAGICIFFFVSILSSIVGSICGIGGGVIIKPVLDATGIMSVSSISFLSGCTVLAMSVISVYKNIKSKSAKLDIKIATSLAIGAAAGGVMGKIMFQTLKDAVGNENLIGLTQAIVLILITVGTLVYTLCKKHIRTKQYTQVWLCIVIGILLGIMSSFLGIGGGPINLVVLAWFFSMSTKEAALSSLYIIMFSQITSLVQTCVTKTIPDVQVSYLIFMVIGGILGGTIGSKINKKIDENTVNKLFIFLMVVIIGINIYNAVKFAVFA